MYLHTYVCMYVGPPNITFINDSVTVLEGVKVNLSCIVNTGTGCKHPLDIQWYKSGSILRANQRVDIYNITHEVTGYVQSVLSFDPVNHTDNGVYTCRALSKPESYTEANVSLTVECELHIYSIHNMYVTVYSIMVLWTYVHNVHYLDVANCFCCSIKNIM